MPSDPDIETILRRIESKELDLQPDFQRGEVWSPGKQRRLIDSILRKWHVPPIHVVEAKGGPLEVLDGQQRLVAIRDFHKGKVRVDGFVEPRDSAIEALHDMTFDNLPTEARNTFLRFGIRLFTIIDYKVGEPAELFFRLNQPALLTSPEQRNAFFGPVRDQIRSIVKIHESTALDPEFIGFSNSRMSHDDVVSRVCFALESKSIRTRITAGALASRYRQGEPFDDVVERRVSLALEILGKTRPHVDSAVRFNKATLFSWLWLLVCAGDSAESNPDGFGKLISCVEEGRRNPTFAVPTNATDNVPTDLLLRLLITYQDRATSRVSDVSSVLIRDFVLWAFLHTFAKPFALDRILAGNAAIVQRLKRSLKAVTKWSQSPEQQTELFEQVLEASLAKAHWGALP